MSDLLTSGHASETGDWYWSIPDHELMEGPHATMADALADAMWSGTAADWGSVNVGRARRTPLCFCIDAYDAFLDGNADADFEGDADSAIAPEAKRALDERVAAVVRQWVDEHGVWSAFRGLEWLSGYPVNRPLCDCAASAVAVSTSSRTDLHA